MKAEHYGLIFRVTNAGYNKFPIIECMIDKRGNSRNIEFAGFLQSGGVKYTQEIIDEANSLDFTQTSENDFVYEIAGYSDEHSAEFFASPKRASFWNGAGYTDIPLQDFLDVLQEWIDFLNSLSFQHILSKR